MKPLDRIDISVECGDVIGNNSLMTLSLIHIFFKNEIEIKNAAGDGFSHSSNGFSYSCYNGAMTKTLNGNIDAKRGMRGSVDVYKRQT